MRMPGKLIDNAARRSLLFCLCVSFSFPLGLSPGYAQSPAKPAFPTRPIRIIQPAPPGGASDVILRSVAQKVGAALGQTLVVENRPGAHGLIANELAARALPDGYSLLYGTVGTIAINSSLYPKLPYRMPEDFAPITQFAEQANLVLVTAALPVRSLSQLVALSKAQSGGLLFGSAGAGSATHLGAEMFRMRSQAVLTHVPYKGAAAAAVAVAAGEVNVLFVSPVTALPFVRTGRLRALAVTTATRFPQLPDVPTVAESGYPGFAYGAWSGILAPAATPAWIIELLHARFVNALKSDDVRELIDKDGASVVWSEEPKAFGVFIRSQIKSWQAVVSQTGVTVQ